jgi:hypothetical protein
MPDKREEWLDKQVATGIAIIGAHPKKVQTSLDLLNFPTVSRLYSVAGFTTLLAFWTDTTGEGVLFPIPSALTGKCDATRCRQSVSRDPGEWGYRGRRLYCHLR